MRIPAIAALSCLFFLACQPNNTQNPPAESIDSNTVNLDTIQTSTLPDVDPKWNRFALMLSGDTSLYSDKNPNLAVWKEYARKSTQKWTILNQKVAEPIQKWVSENNYNDKYTTRTLLYPFAGVTSFMPIYSSQIKTRLSW